jgi:tRNA-binding EMAP/Myf-like protein
MMKGKIVSEGMILAAEDENGNLGVLTVDGNIGDGAEVN